MKVQLQNQREMRATSQPVVLTFGYVYRSSFGSPGASAVNCFQTLQDKENNYYYLRYQEMNKKLPIWCDNDRLNLLAEHFSHVRIGFGIFPSRVQDSYQSTLKLNLQKNIVVPAHACITHQLHYYNLARVIRETEYAHDSNTQWPL